MDRKLTWRRAECESMECVEVAAAGELVMLRSSALPLDEVTLTRGEWGAFLSAVKRGEFDKLGD